MEGRETGSDGCAARKLLSSSSSEERHRSAGSTVITSPYKLIERQVVEKDSSAALVPRRQIRMPSCPG